MGDTNIRSTALTLCCTERRGQAGVEMGQMDAQLSAGFAPRDLQKVWGSRGSSLQAGSYRRRARKKERRSAGTFLAPLAPSPVRGPGTTAWLESSPNSYSDL